MTKRVFDDFASRIASELVQAGRTHEAYNRAEYAANVFAVVASHENPRFNRERFMRACGLREVTK